MRKEKKKEETERERMERLNREYNDIDWVGLYNSDKLSSLIGGGRASLVQQQVTSSLSEVETDSQSDVVDRVVGSSPIGQVTNCRWRLILYQNPAWKHYRRQNMDESGHGSRETIMLVGTK